MPFCNNFRTIWVVSSCLERWIFSGRIKSYISLILIRDFFEFIEELDIIFVNLNYFLELFVSFRSFNGICNILPNLFCSTFFPFHSISFFFHFLILLFFSIYLLKFVESRLDIVLNSLVFFGILDKVSKLIPRWF